MFSALKMLFSPRGWATIFRRAGKGIPAVFRGIRTSSRLMWRSLKRGYRKYPLAYNAAIAAGATGVVLTAYERLHTGAETRAEGLAERFGLKDLDTLPSHYFSHARQELRDASQKMLSSFSADDVSRKDILSFVKAYHTYLRALPDGQAEFALVANEHLGSIADLGLAVDLHPQSDFLEAAMVNIQDDGQSIKNSLLDFSHLIALDQRSLPFKLA